MEEIQRHNVFRFLFWLCCVFVAVQGLSLVTKHTLQSTQASVFVAHKLSCPVECEIFLDQGSNLCSLHWQVDSYPLHHQGSSVLFILNEIKSNLETSPLPQFYQTHEKFNLRD